MRVHVYEHGSRLRGSDGSMRWMRASVGLGVRAWASVDGCRRRHRCIRSRFVSLPPNPSVTNAIYRADHSLNHPFKHQCAVLTRMRPYTLFARIVDSMHPTETILSTPSQKQFTEQTLEKSAVATHTHTPHLTSPHRAQMHKRARTSTKVHVTLTAGCMHDTSTVSIALDLSRSHVGCLAQISARGVHLQ